MPGGGAPQPASAQGSSPTSAVHDRALLDSVLRQTLEESTSGEELDPAEKTALLEVAGRHRGQPLSLDPIVLELVEAVLRTHFRNLAGSSEFWRLISAQIARSLFDDPVAHSRLELFWDRLCGKKS